MKLPAGQSVCGAAMGTTAESRQRRVRVFLPARGSEPGRRPALRDLRAIFPCNLIRKREDDCSNFFAGGEDFGDELTNAVIVLCVRREDERSQLLDINGAAAPDHGFLGFHIDDLADKLRMEA